MKNKEEIIINIKEQWELRKRLEPIGDRERSFTAGWIEALRWVLRDERMNKLLKGANNETIKKAQKRLAEDCGFGQRDDDIDIKVDSIRDGWLHGPQQLPSGHAKA